jgi:diguanylate cyclase (GGDEF)-like protein
MHRLAVETAGAPACVVVMDIDHFKNVNDSYGHGAGDRVIQSAVAACRSVLRPQDILARIGGEEFAIVLPGLSMTEGLKAAERMRAAVAAQTTAAREGTIAITASFGLTTTAASPANFEAAITAADFAMYEAKAAGRNTVRVSSAGPAQSRMNKIA